MIVRILHPSPAMQQFGPYRDVAHVQSGPSMSLPESDARRHLLTFKNRHVLHLDLPNTKYVCCVTEDEND